jgi:peptidoglycan-associated lipoprotein
MQTLRMLVVGVTLIAIGACGGKSKKEDTGASSNEQVSTDTGADTSTEPAATDTSGEAAPVDPATLSEVIYFSFDSSDLDPEAREKLNENAAWLREDASRTLRIEGHTDEVGTPEYNIGLGERRARAAKDYLVRLGIEEGRVDVISYGEEKPAADSDELNRRSVFIATKQ